MNPPFAVADLGEIALGCRDMEAMLAFYRDILGLEVLRAPENGIAFFRIGEGHAGHTKVLALFDGREGRDGRGALHHLALNIAFATQAAAVTWFRDQGHAPRVETFDWIGWRGFSSPTPKAMWWNWWRATQTGSPEERYNA